MPGNLGISAGGTPWVIHPKKTISYQGTPLVGNSATINPNEFNKFEDMEYLKVTLGGLSANTYQEYLFEFVSVSDAMVFAIKSTEAVKWPVMIDIKNGYRYQVSVLNGVALWTEVPA